jgi:uncharacterized protein YyaL (SSP411 family)
MTNRPPRPTFAAMTENLLRFATSPYLLQHKDNPVHWQPWGAAALTEAAAANKPILLSVGYAACHWCHVMAHESFEDPATAELMNRLFVPIKVDREERPDIDQIYMAALHALGEQGGWPLTMFLTPAGEPIWGGTYFPPTARYGRPAFRDIMNEVARLFREEPEKIAQNRDYLLRQLNEAQNEGSVDVGPGLLDVAGERLLSLMDTVRGGTRGAPKFPQAGLLEFLWRAGERTDDPRYRDVVLLTLREISNGGIYDHIGGGFARYSTDDRWLVPHFEKMLYDNAQLLELIAFAWLKTGDPLFAERADETVAWLTREMRLPGGAFAASLDADSEGHEGKFYVWTRHEILDVLGTEEGTFFADAYDVTDAGNWEGQSIPNRTGKPRLSETDEARLARARTALLARRATRIRPATDDKVLADWNGLMIAALAVAGAAFDRPDWIALATDAFAFIEREMMNDGRLAHAWRGKPSVFPGLASDYAALAKAALALHTATFDGAWLTKAAALMATLRAHHWNAAEPGYFVTADDADALIVRPKATTDEAVPGATSLAAQNLVRLWHLTGDDSYRADVDAILASAGPAIAANLFATTGLLNALDLRLGAVDVVLVTPEHDSGADLLHTVRAHFTPNTILSRYVGSVSLPETHPAHGKTIVGDRPTAYVCRGETCSLPVTEPELLTRAMAAS